MTERCANGLIILDRTIPNYAESLPIKMNLMLNF